jgi:hypothetical protein
MRDVLEAHGSATVSADQYGSVADRCAMWAMRYAAEQKIPANVQVQIAATLREHTDRGVIDGWAYCKCGWFLKDHSADAHRRHVAERLTARGLR